MPNVAMKHEQDPRQTLIKDIGDLSDFEIAFNEILIAIYMRPEKTKGGIVMVPKNLQEDLYQSKVGLVVKMGNHLRLPFELKLHDWIVVRPNDVYSLDVNFVPCRLVFDDQVRARVQDPGSVW